MPALDPGDQLLGATGRPAAGCSETLAIRWIGTCAGGVGERAAVGAAEALEPRPSAGRAGSRPATPSLTRSHCCAGDALVVAADVARPCSTVRSPVTCMSGGAVPQRAELVEGRERRAGVVGLVAERAVELGGVADRLVDRQPQVGRVDDQVVAARPRPTGARSFSASSSGSSVELGVPVPAGRRSGTPSRGRPAARGCASSRSAPASWSMRHRRRAPGCIRTRCWVVRRAGEVGVELVLLAPSSSDRVDVVDAVVRQQPRAPVGEQRDLLRRRGPSNGSTS